MMVVAGTVTVSLEVGADANKIKKTVTLTLVCNTRFLPLECSNWFDTGIRMDITVKNQNRKGDLHISRFLNLNIYIIICFNRLRRIYLYLCGFHRFFSVFIIVSIAAIKTAVMRLPFVPICTWLVRVAFWATSLTWSSPMRPCMRGTSPISPINVHIGSARPLVKNQLRPSTSLMWAFGKALNCAKPFRRCHASWWCPTCIKRILQSHTHSDEQIAWRIILLQSCNIFDFKYGIIGHGYISSLLYYLDSLCRSVDLLKKLGPICMGTRHES